MSTLSEQLNHENKRRIQKFNDAHFEWLMRFDSHYTHAITLTFNQKRIRRMEDLVSTKKMMDKADLLKLLKKSFYCFCNRFDKSLFGNASARHGDKLLMVPVLEGLFQDGKVHYHCAVGVPKDRFEGIDTKVREAWRHALLTGYQVDVKPYRNSGWLGYSNKQAKFVNRECIDWENVRIPVMLNQFPSNAE